MCCQFRVRLLGMMSAWSNVTQAIEVTVNGSSAEQTYEVEGSIPCQSIYTREVPSSMSSRNHVGRPLLFALLLGISASAIAQVEEPPAPPAESVTPPPEEVAPLDEKKIDQFADAYLAIEEIHAKAAEELKSTTDPESANKVKADAETQIIQAVEQSGLRLDEFNQIAELMAVDVQLRAKIASRVQERRRI
jgi:hypothetical protein